MPGSERQTRNQSSRFAPLQLEETKIIILLLKEFDHPRNVLVSLASNYQTKKNLPRRATKPLHIARRPTLLRADSGLPPPALFSSRAKPFFARGRARSLTLPPARPTNGPPCCAPLFTPTLHRFPRQFLALFRSIETFPLCSNRTRLPPRHRRTRRLCPFPRSVVCPRFFPSQRVGTRPSPHLPTPFPRQHIYSLYRNLSPLYKEPTSHYIRHTRPIWGQR